MSNYAIFSHYNSNSSIEDYVFSYLSALAENEFKIVFVSTSQIKSNQIQTLKEICDDVIIRDNAGYDFYSWKVGYDCLSEEKIDNLILCNDSCYVSRNKLTKILKIFKNSDKDLWSITESYDYNYHFQSYFIYFSRKIANSKDFSLFINDIKSYSDREKVISNYELQFMRFFKSKGYKVSSFIKYKYLELFYYGTKAKLKVLLDHFNKISQMSAKRKSQEIQKKTFQMKLKKITELAWIFLNPLNVNPSLYLWKESISKGSPFVKTLLFKSNPFGDNDIRTDNPFLKDNGFDANEIKHHIKNVRSSL